ncbi:MAG: hypothetical protein WBV94_20165 [Blastocatellia bacterium]
MIRNPRTFIAAIIFATVILPVSILGAKPKVFNVATSEDFQTALNSAKQGDVIEIEANASLVGNFVLPDKTDSPASRSDDWVTIRSSAADEQLPPEGTRITPAYSNAMPKLISPNTEPALRAEPGAHHFRFIAIEITIAPQVMLNFGIVRLGEGSETDQSLLPRDILIDRCYIHGHPVADVSRAIALNSARTDITDSYISDIHGIGFDTQAICGWNGPGPFRIINNYLEAAGENVLFGGADPKIENLVPADIEFRRNDCSKPLSWKEGILTRPTNLSSSAMNSFGSNLVPGATYYYRITSRGRAGYSTTATSVASDEIAIALATDQNSINIAWSATDHATEYRVYRTSDAPDAESRNWVYYTATEPAFTDVGDAIISISGSTPAVAGTRWSVKNILELKNARRVIIDGNLFENNWVDAQSGFAILFTVRNQDGTAAWSVTEDVSFTNNIVRHAAAGINILGRDDIHTSDKAKRLSIKNNLFYDIGGAAWGGNGRFLQITETENVTVDHNTVIHTGNIITAYGVPNTDFSFTNNLVPNNAFGVIGDDSRSGNITIEKYLPSSVFKKNVIINGQAAAYPMKNFFPASIDEVGFVDAAMENFRLAPSSPYRKAGTKKKDIGADIDAIDKARNK